MYVHNILSVSQRSGAKILWKLALLTFVIYHKWYYQCVLVHRYIWAYLAQMVLSAFSSSPRWYFMDKKVLSQDIRPWKWVFSLPQCGAFSEQILVKLDNFILQTIWKRFGEWGQGGEMGDGERNQLRFSSTNFESCLEMFRIGIIKR